jgi:hypothetical protein
MRRFERVFQACARNVPKQCAKINTQMSALLSAEDAPERRGGAPQRIAGVVRCSFDITPYNSIISEFFNVEKCFNKSIMLLKT